MADTQTDQADSGPAKNERSHASFPDVEDEASDRTSDRASDNASETIVQEGVLAKIPNVANGSDNKPPEPEVQPLYSIYTSRQKGYIVFMSALGGFFSPLSANTYLPATPSLASYLGVSPSLINLTVTAFLLFQGLAPSIYGDLADFAGRRPAYLLSFVVYVAANIGLATQSSYAALFVLRCLQVCSRSVTSPMPKLIK
jgi:hypothetical protein